jgi:hypothetical protein
MVVWYEIFKWLGVVVVMPPNLFLLFDCLSVAARNKKIRKGFSFDLAYGDLVYLEGS